MAFEWTQLVPIIGGLLGAGEASSAADRAAAANIEAAKIASDAAQFRPYAISTGFGTSYFDPSKSQAGYEIDPLLAAFRDKFYGTGAQFLDQMQVDPQAAAQQYYQEQQALMAPQRQAEDIALRQQQLQSGRIGLGVSGQALGAGAPGVINQGQYQRDLARAQADAMLAAQSRERAQSDIDRLIARGTGLFQTGLGVEEQALRPLTIGADIGSRQAVAGGQQANALLQGGLGAAQANLAGGIGAANALLGGAQAFSGLFAPQRKTSIYG